MTSISKHHFFTDAICFLKCSNDLLTLCRESGCPNISFGFSSYCQEIRASLFDECMSTLRPWCVCVCLCEREMEFVVIGASKHDMNALSQCFFVII